MSLTEAKLTAMALEDGVSSDDFIKFTISVYEEVMKHSPCGCFDVILPKTGYRQPMGAYLGRSTRDSLIELLYRLRECAPGEHSVTMLARDGSRPQRLVVHTK